MSNPVQDLVDSDSWSMAHGDGPAGPIIIRFRTPVLGPGDGGEWNRLVRVAWSYSKHDIEALPSPDDTQAMSAFENLLCETLEPDLVAVLVATLTFGGTRQWLWYTRDVDEFGKRMNGLPPHDERYPIQLDTREDPNWDCLRNEVIPAEHR